MGALLDTKSGMKFWFWKLTTGLGINPSRNTETGLGSVDRCGGALRAEDGIIL
jgi:hypothetical protein